MTGSGTGAGFRQLLDNHEIKSSHLTRANIYLHSQVATIPQKFAKPVLVEDYETGNCDMDMEDTSGSERDVSMHDSELSRLDTGHCNLTYWSIVLSGLSNTSSTALRKASGSSSGPTKVAAQRKPFLT